MNEKKLKIAFVESRWSSFYGAQQSMFTLVSNLDHHLFQPVVVTTGKGELARRFCDAGIEVKVFPLGPLVNKFGGVIEKYSLWKKFNVIIELLKLNTLVFYWLLKNKVNIVYANDERSLLYVALAAKITRLPVIWYVRQDERINIIFKFGAIMADKIITIADGVQRAFTQKEIEKNKQKFTTLYTGFDIDKYQSGATEENEIKKQYGIPNSAKIVGLVGSVTPRKGYDMLVEAMAEIRRTNDVHCLMIGGVSDGYYDFKKSLEQKIESLGLVDRVHWAGYVEDIVSHYAAMDILVLPSRSEGLPRVIIEGLAAGLPVVATDVGGAGEIITSGILGRLIPVDDTGELAKAINDTLQEDKQTHKYERQNYTRQVFSIDKYVNGFQSIVQDLIL